MKYCAAFLLLATACVCIGCESNGSSDRRYDSRRDYDSNKAYEANRDSLQRQSSPMRESEISASDTNNRDSLRE